MGYSTGIEKRIVIKATHDTATQPTNIPPFGPKLNGPATNLFLATVILNNIGNAYDMYIPIVAIDTVAWNATWLPNDCTCKMHIANIIDERRNHVQDFEDCPRIKKDNEYVFDM